LIPERLPHLLSVYSTNLLSRICLLRFFKHKLKMSKSHFFQMAPRIYYILQKVLEIRQSVDRVLFRNRLLLNNGIQQVVNSLIVN
jgi:hypothetical protein